MLTFSGHIEQVQDAYDRAHRLEHHARLIEQEYHEEFQYGPKERRAFAAQRQRQAGHAVAYWLYFRQALKSMAQDEAPDVSLASTLESQEEHDERWWAAAGYADGYRLWGAIMDMALRQENDLAFGPLMTVLRYGPPVIDGHPTLDLYTDVPHELV